MAALEIFFWMGGYAYYIWPAYFITLMVLVMPWFSSRKKWKNYLKKLKIMTSK